MSELSLPRAARPFLAFVAALRANGFAVAPEQTTTFLSAIELIGPRSLEHIRRAGLATLAPPPERHAAFNVLFRLHFMGETGMDGEIEAEDEAVKVQEEGAGFDEALFSDETSEAGEAPTGLETLTQRRFDAADPAVALRRLAREAPRRLPTRRSYRKRRARRGAGIDLRRTLRDAARHDGEVLRLTRLRRRTRLRKILLLIDVSGSMKARTEEHLRLAHVLAQTAPAIEVFTFGTRLTRVTRAMRLKRREQALASAANLVSDWDGGTRIGEALQAFLAVPRFAGYARGAAVLILSDGLERGDPAALRDAAMRLSRRAWRLSWLTPLATGAGFTPQTEGLLAIAPYVNDFAPGGSLTALTAHILSLGDRRAA